MNRFILITITAVMITACGEKSSSPPITLAPPSDAALAKLYDTSCKTCHTSKASSAPLAGDVAAWAPRLAKGKDVLLNHTINGYRSMPPMGLCAQCTEAEFTALIEYMAATKLP